jgi:pimeloyl-ACP methyl ester carboxylesterase
MRIGELFRTPEERFDGLPGYPFRSHYVELDGLRLHHLDEGSGPTVLCFHGEPSWSYLYRHMVDGLVAAGYRAGSLFCDLIPGAGEQVRIEGAAHFLQEDRGPQIVAAMLAAFGR